MNLIEILLTLVGHTKSDRATMMADMGVSTLNHRGRSNSAPCPL